jgi:aspartate aminotransferase
MTTLSTLGEKIIGSQIIKINTTIKAVKDKTVYNYTIGDFDPKINHIPLKLQRLIVAEYENNQTNYPSAQGEISLRKSISEHYATKGVIYSENEILIGAGVRPLIYTIYKTIVNPNQGVLYAAPSWNNDHYSFLASANSICVETTQLNNFNLTARDVLNNIGETRLICLCSPQNPTGSVMYKDTLRDICELVLLKNSGGKPETDTYILYDQIYSELSDMSYHPLTVCPKIKPFLICVDGVSKSLSATGIRVGWMMASENVIKQATQIFSHIGAWAPKPEQLAVAKYLGTDDYKDYIEGQKTHFQYIQEGFMLVIDKYKSYGFDYIKPDGGIYLAIKLPYRKTTTDLNYFLSFLINECNIGVVPFDYFGCKDSEWFRMSFGNVSTSGYSYESQIEHFNDVLSRLKIFFNIERISD